MNIYNKKVQYYTKTYVPPPQQNPQIPNTQMRRYVQEQEIKEIKIVNLPKDIKGETTNVKGKKEFELIPNQYTTSPLYSLYNPYANFPYIKKQFYSRSPRKNRGGSSIRHIAGEYKIRFAYDDTDYNRAKSDEIGGREATSSEQRSGGLKRLFYNQQHEVGQFSNYMEASKKAQLQYYGNVSGNKEINIKKSGVRESGPEVSRKDNLKYTINTGERIIGGKFIPSGYKGVSTKVAQAIKDTYFDYEKGQNLIQNIQENDSRKVKIKYEKSSSKNEGHGNEEENVNETSGIFRTPAKDQTPIIKQNVKLPEEEIRDSRKDNKYFQEKRINEHNDKKSIKSATLKDEEEEENDVIVEKTQEKQGKKGKSTTKENPENTTSDISSQKKKDEDEKSTTEPFIHPGKENETEERSKKWINYSSKASNLDSVNEVNEDSGIESKSNRTKIKEFPSDLSFDEENSIVIVEFTIDNNDSIIIIGESLIKPINESNNLKEIPKEKLIKLNNVLYLKEEISYSEEDIELNIKVIKDSKNQKIIVDLENNPIPQLENNNYYIIINKKRIITNVIIKRNSNDKTCFIRNDTKEEITVCFFKKKN